VEKLEWVEGEEFEEETRENVLIFKPVKKVG